MPHHVHPVPGEPLVGKRRLRRRLSAGAVLVCAAASLTLAPLAFSAQAPVGLGTAANFAVLAGSTVTNTGPSVISGSVGLDPGSAVTGFPPGIVLAGTTEIADGVALQAKNDLVTAYNDAAGRSSTATVSGDLAGRTLVSGVYTSASTLGLSGALTLDAQGNPGAVFIFQAGSSLIVGSSSQVVLIGGAQACNVYWQVGSSATIGTGSSFVGTIMALTSVTMTTGATLQGRALARNGAVTLDTNTITSPTCATGASTTGGSSTTTTSPGSGSGAGGGGSSTTTGPGTKGSTGASGTTGTNKPKPKTKPKPKKHKPKKPKSLKPVPKPVKPATPTPVKPTAPKPPAFTG
jgi:Ice-binding-like